MFIPNQNSADGLTELSHDNRRARSSLLLNLDITDEHELLFLTAPSDGSFKIRQIFCIEDENEKKFRLKLLKQNKIQLFGLLTALVFNLAVIIMETAVLASKNSSGSYYRLVVLMVEEILTLVFLKL